MAANSVRKIKERSIPHISAAAILIIVKRRSSMWERKGLDSSPRLRKAKNFSRVVDGRLAELFTPAAEFPLDVFRRGGAGCAPRGEGCTQVESGLNDFRS